MVHMILVAALATSGPLPAFATETHRFNVPIEAAVDAIRDFAAQAHVQILVDGENVKDKQLHPVLGEYSTDQGLGVLLADSGLKPRYVGDHSIALVTLAQAANAGSQGTDRAQEEKKNDSFRVAPVDRGAASSTSSVDSSPPSSSQGEDRGRDTLSEIIVTASKRPEVLREVANSVTAFTDEQLRQLGAQSFQDYIGRSPGVNFLSSTPGISNVTIRGIGTTTANPDQGQATTGIYLNDIPLTDPSFAVSVPDLDTFDLQRVEVLRGPQGTLFGSATLGGAVNYILNPVSLTDYAVRAEASGSKTQSAADLGYSAKVAVNVPIVTDTLGVRVAVLKRFEPGYLNNIGIGKKDSNSHDVAGLRFNALWKINSRVKLSLFSFYDHTKNADDFYAFPELGDLVRTSIAAERRTFVTRVNSLKLDSDLDFATFSVAVADSHKSSDWLGDFSAYYGAPTIGLNTPTTHSKLVEARLTSPGDQRVDWLAGLYYGWFDEIYPSPTFQGGVDIYDFTVGYRSNETSEFTEVTYHFNDMWKATVGGRYYDIRLATQTIQGIPGSDVTDQGAQRGTGLSPKASLSFEPNQNMVTYALVSKGYRMGGVNLVPPIASFPTPATYRSDSLLNYELGLRVSSSDHRLTFDPTIFYIDWSDVQIQLHRPDGFAYVANAGRSHSKGVEGNLTWRAVDHLDLQASATYLDAALAESLALGNGTTLLKGTPLPGSSKWSLSETAIYRFDAPGTPFVTLSHRFVSRSESSFTRAVPIGNYNVFDARAGADIGQFTLTLYGSNLTDRRGVTSGALLGLTNQIIDYYIRPRTVGLQLDWRL